jgi:drug/metabolite transporter (DMT)-like permease
MVMTGLRSLIAATVLGCTLLLVKRSAFRLASPKRDVPFLLLFGVCAQAGMQFTYFQAIATNGVGTAVLLEYLAPVFSLAIGIIFLRHRVRWALLVGVALALLGCALVVGVANPQGMQVTRTGLFWGVISAFFYSLYTVLGSQVRDRFEPMTLLFYGMLVSALTWLLVLGPARVLAPLQSSTTAATVVALAIVATLVPFGAFLMALRYIPAVNAGITAMAEPVLASVGGAVFFAEALSISFVGGGLLILGAIAVIQLADRRAPTILADKTQ